MLKTALHAVHARAEEPVECQGCHELVAGEYLPAKSWRCTECHGDTRLVLHEAASPESGAQQCWSCHDFTAADAAPTPCSSCHGEAQGAVRAIPLHDPNNPNEDCASCHRPHQDPSLKAAADCESCHDDTPVSGHTAPDIQITGCDSCHGYHETATVASTRCTNCHRQSRAEVPLTATFENGHDKCISCHRPHRFVKTEVIGCNEDCHEGQTALAETRVAKHRGCRGCHTPHAVRASAQRTCERCHSKNIDPKHPNDRKTRTRCLGCHKPHGGPRAPVAVGCSRCHDEARTDRGLHQTAAHKGPACENCHRPHEFDLKETGTALCKGCHGPQPFKNAKSVSLHEKHDDCFRCHGEAVAHQPDAERAACSSCHEDKGKLVSPKHQDCVKCHEPHSARVRKQCGNCHQDQARTAPEKHSTCRDCHEPHSARVTKRCADCHKDRTTGIHAAVEDRCAACHRPHGPKGKAAPPECVSCHERAALPGLHRVSDHVKCTSCHRSHGGQPYRRRASCLGECHEDKVNHEPTAKLCIGCHPFGGAQ